MEGNNNKGQLYSQLRLKRTVLDLNIMDKMCTYQNIMIRTFREFRFSTSITLNMENKVIILSMVMVFARPKFLLGHLLVLARSHAKFGCSGMLSHGEDDDHIPHIDGVHCGEPELF